jgi:capsular exopolysaccharide synthesis family protein
MCLLACTPDPREGLDRSQRTQERANMSRIFDALQRSVAEHSGIEYPDMISVVANSLEVPQEQSSLESEPPRRGQLVADEVPLASALTEGDSINASLDFPSVETRVAPSSRLVFLTEPDSLAAEKFRFLGVRLRHLRQSRPLKTVLITSTIAEEGKSLVSANLAGVLARKTQKVLLIEGDLRRPGLVQQFGLKGLSGLGEWLQSGQQAISGVYYLHEPNLWLMPAGHPPENALELMQSGRLSELMRQVASLFDWVIVDSPPLLPLGDTSVWTRLTDGTVLVAREGKTEKLSLQQGLEILKKSDLLGVVLNGCMDLNRNNYYQYYSPPGARATSRTE